MRGKSRLILWGICGGLLVIASAALFFRHRTSVAGGIAVLSYGENQIVEFQLNRNNCYHMESNGYTIHIQVKDGQAAFVDSPCPDHLCEHFGWLSETDDMAVCLPAAAMLTIEDSKG